MLELGAFRDKWNHDTIACYKCNSKLDPGDILAIMVEENLTFKETGNLLHTAQNPWCDIVQNLSVDEKRKVLGKEAVIR